MLSKLSFLDCANVDPDPNCDYWADQGYCTETYVYYMEQNCHKSCGYCSK